MQAPWSLLGEADEAAGGGGHAEGQAAMRPSGVGARSFHERVLQQVAITPTSTLVIAAPGAAHEGD